MSCVVSAASHKTPSQFLGQTLLCSEQMHMLDATDRLILFPPQEPPTDYGFLSDSHSQARLRWVLALTTTPSSRVTHDNHMTHGDHCVSLNGTTA